jgi:hypothetical protein
VNGGIRTSPSVRAGARAREGRRSAERKEYGKAGTGSTTFTYTAKRFTFTYTVVDRVRERVRVRVRVRYSGQGAEQAQSGYTRKLAPLLRDVPRLAALAGERGC